MNKAHRCPSGPEARSPGRTTTRSGVYHLQCPPVGIGLRAVVNFLLATLYVHRRHSGAAGAQEAKARQ